MDSIKLATPEQIEKIRATSDLGPTSLVYAMGEDLAVVKAVTEIDPVYFDANSNTSRRLLFIWGLENMLRGNGIPAYYFNTLADDANASWRKVVETHGAHQVSTAPEFRFKKEL